MDRTLVQRKWLLIGALITIALIFVWRFRSASTDSTADDAGDDGASESIASQSGSSRADSKRTLSGRPKTLRASPGMGGVVWGKVLDAQSEEPVPYVDIIFRIAGQEESATSDEEGRYEISLSSGSYRIRALGDGVIAKAMAPLRVGQIDRLEFDVFVTRLATIRGRVTDPSGRGIVGAEVALRTDTASAKAFPHRGEIGLAESESDGSFELLVPPGSADLRASEGQGEVYATVTSLVAGTTLKDVSLVIDQRGVVTGVVTQPGGAGAKGASVYVSVNRPGTGQFDRRVVETDRAGRFEVENLRPGLYVVEALLDGFGSSNPVRFTLMPSASTKDSDKELSLALHEPLALAGIVLDENGDAVADAEVAQVRIGSKQRYTKQRTSEDGRFEFTGLGPGPHMVRARKEGFAAIENLDVRAPNRDVELHLMGTGGLDGSVTSAEGPVTRFTIEYRSKGKKTGPSAQFLAKDGRFNIFPVDPGSYTVIISAKGFATQTVTGVDVPSAGYGEASVALKAQ